MTDSLKDINEKMLKLKEKFYPSLIDKIEQIEKLGNNINNETINEIYSIIHKLSGSSAMYGFYEISDISNEFELFLKKMIQNDLNVESYNKIGKYINKLVDIKNGKRINNA